MSASNDPARSCGRSAGRGRVGVEHASARPTRRAARRPSEDRDSHQSVGVPPGSASPSGSGLHGAGSTGSPAKCISTKVAAAQRRHAERLAALAQPLGQRRRRPAPAPARPDRRRAGRRPSPGRRACPGRARCAAVRLRVAGSGSRKPTASVRGRPRANDRSQHQLAQVAGADDQHVRLPAALQPDEAVVERGEGHARPDAAGT